MDDDEELLSAGQVPLENYVEANELELELYYAEVLTTQEKQEKIFQISAEIYELEYSFSAQYERLCLLPDFPQQDSTTNHNELPG